jgi:hypothetical protein
MAPTLYRIILQVDNLDKAEEFYAQLLGDRGRRIPRGASGCELGKRPWGERSFYAHDPWGNGLCFVDETTLFTGK